MKFVKTKSSDWDYREIIEINSLQDLLDLCKNEGRFIINKTEYKGDKYSKTDGWEIEIYDTWRE